MFANAARRLSVRLAYALAPRRRERGAQTVDIMLWVAVMIVVVGAVGLIFRNSVVTFFNGLVYDIGFTR
jgi:multisubunit Na+/H+ antiporter MnhB subunit